MTNCHIVHVGKDLSFWIRCRTDQVEHVVRRLRGKVPAELKAAEFNEFGILDRFGIGRAVSLDHVRRCPRRQSIPFIDLIGLGPEGESLTGNTGQLALHQISNDLRIRKREPGHGLSNTGLALLDEG